MDGFYAQHLVKAIRVSLGSKLAGRVTPRSDERKQKNFGRSGNETNLANVKRRALNRAVNRETEANALTHTAYERE